MRKPVNVRRIATVAVAPLLLVALAACGADEETAAADLTTAAASPETSASSSAEDPDGAEVEEIDPQDFVNRISSAFDDSTTARLSMKVTSSGLAMSATGQVDYTEDTPAMSLEMIAPSLGEGTFEMRLIDDVMYMSMPMVDPSGKFFKIDLKDPDNPLGESMGDFEAFDPQSTIETFSKGVLSVKLLGEESIDGEPTTHYQVTATTKDLGETLSGNPADLPEEFTYDIWLDVDDRMRRMTADLGRQASVDMQMTDFGEDVDIAAPPAHLVQTMPGV